MARRPLLLGLKKPLIVAWLWSCVVASCATAVDYVEIQEAEAGGGRALVGQVLVEAQDGGMLLEEQDGHVWTLQPRQIVSRRSDETPFTRLGKKELGERLLRELPAGFQLHDTAHYLVAYNTTRAYAQWCGGLFEQLYRVYFNHWEKMGLKLEKPPLLVAVVFRDATSYRDYCRSELGEAAESIIGYYSLASNRILTYDMTGMEQLQAPGVKVRTQDHIQMLLSRPAAERTVATVIHEATHQLAFNSGLQTRFADNPFWLSEGLAIYFESPDLSSRRGWKRVGEINETRLRGMRDYLARRPATSLASLITDDQRFRQTQEAKDAYAEAWSLCYFLIRRHPDGFRRYLEIIRGKQALGRDTPEQRLREFQEAFGVDLTSLDRDLLRALESWR
jgi:hypothetical protein